MSVFYSLLAAVETRLASLELLGSPAVKLAKLPSRLESDSVDLVVVSPLSDADREEYMPTGIVIEYGVQITLHQPGDRDERAQLERFLDWREQIRQALFVPAIPSVSAVYDVRMELAPPFGQGSFQANYDITQLRFFWLSSESRSNTWTA